MTDKIRQFVLSEIPKGTLTPEHFVVKTLVTTELIRRIADQRPIESMGHCARDHAIEEAIDATTQVPFVGRHR